ncbi:MAG: hypothetical protein KDB22_22200 [Planctomycetales bacterium]|nr:hypothetical protein [Planctomycetales bacterium]
MPTVASPVRTTIVNAAFLQEVKESNFVLWEVLNDLRELARSKDFSNVAIHKFVSQLASLRDGIGVQFSLEETYGFFEGVPRFAAIAMGNAKHARDQHRELYLHLHEICERAEEAQYRGTIARDLPIFLGAFEGFDDAFRAHEQLEAELIRTGLGLSRFGGG